MDNAEAIKRIEDHIRVLHIGKYPHIKIAEALNMAISALANDNNVGHKVEVVRCKDCKNWQPIHEHIPHMECQIFCGAYEHGYPTNADDFCSYGERKDNE